jgi:hemerythrin-like metal-binding protein
MASSSDEVLVAWNSGLSIGIAEVDTQHQELIDIINCLWRAVLDNDDDSIIEELLKRLTSYTKTHFSAEEMLMSSFDYPELTAHREAHKDFIMRLNEATKAFKAGKPISMNLLHFLNEWLQNHIKIEDRDYATFIDRKKNGGFLKGFGNLFKRLRGKSPTKEALEEPSLQGLNMQKAITAHMAWNKRLAALLEGHGEKINAEDAGRDDLCILGNWIYANENNTIRSLAEFETLREDHKKFHKCAGQVVTLHDSGRKDEASQVHTKDLKELSNTVRLDIIRLYAAHNREHD